MWTPTSQVGIERIRRLGVYHLAQLEAVEGLEAIAGEFRTRQDGLTAMARAHLLATDALANAVGARDCAHEELDDTIRTMAHMVRRVGGRGARSHRYRSYFPRGTGGVAGRSVEAAIHGARDLLARLQAETEPLLRGQIAPLSDALREMEEAQSRHEEAGAACRRARALLLVEKQAWIDGYRASHSRLRLHFLHAPERAEGFFRRRASCRCEETDASLSEAPPGRLDLAA